MTFRVTGKESLMGGPPPPDTRFEKWIIEQRALAASARGQYVAKRDARREQRVREDYQARNIAAGEASAARARENGNPGSCWGSVWAAERTYHR